MSSTTLSSVETANVTQLRLASPSGPVTRTILRAPLRDASPSEIPMIDVAQMFSPLLEDRQKVARQIHDAASNYGFFCIKNHGVSTPTIQDAYRASLDFFRQDAETKSKASIAQSAVYNGYRAPDTQQVNPDEGVDVREGFTVRYHPRFDPDGRDADSMPDEVKEFIPYENFMFDNTKHLPQFQESVVGYLQACLTLARALTRTFALSLDLPEDAFDDKIRYPDGAVSLNYYPPIENTGHIEPSNPKARVSIGAHTDFQLFTILWQDDVGGLQVLSREGRWISVKPVPDTFVVNIADCFQRITNDKYKSTVHRAQNWSGRERISIPFFLGFQLNETCSVLDTCVGPGEEKKYDDIICGEWLKQRVQDMQNLEELCKTE